MRELLIVAATSYMIGSIPFGYLVVRIFRGEDVRQSGSGNIGATNVSRKSPALGLLTLLLDALKGMCAVLLAKEVLAATTHSYFDFRLYPMMSLAAICAILGHMFPVWLSFHGGKGVATAVGAFALIIPRATLGAFVIFVVVVLASRFVSLASIVAAVSLPIFAWVSLRNSHSVGLLTLVLISIASTLVIVKHHENIRRLLAGAENRFGTRGTK